MAVKFKDYYEILGVTRDTSPEKIKSSFRRLAREYHPDMNKGDSGAEEKFKNINEAYEVLRDTDKRRRYDLLGPNYHNGQDFQPPPGWENVRNGFGGDRFGSFSFGSSSGGFSDFFEAIFGDFGAMGNSSATFTNRVRSSGGFGQARASSRGQNVEIELPLSLEEAHRGGKKQVSVRLTEVCPTCGGSGRLVGGGGSGTCSECKGQGQIDKIINYNVRIPLGVINSDRIRLAGQGVKGTGGGKDGDLYLRIKLMPHPIYRVSGSDLEFDLRLAPWEAALGTSVTIPTLDETVEIKVKRGTSSGDRLRLRGKGLALKEGGRGEIYAVIKIVVPPKPSNKEKELYSQLAKESKFKARP